MTGKPKTGEPEVVTADEARRLLEQDKRQRAEACLREIQAALERHRCQLQAVPGLTPDGRVVAQVTVTALD